MNSVDVSPTNGFSQLYGSMNSTLTNKNPLVLGALSLIIIFYFIVFTYLGYTVSYSSDQQESNGMKVIEIVMWGLIVFLVLINGIQYFFSIDVKTAVKNLFQGTPEVDIKIQPESKLITKKGKGGKGIDGEIKDLEKDLENDLGFGGSPQVFNIPGNEYTYTDAKALCKAYGSTVATYNQIEDAYKGGAEWCNYGWSANQLALFPTQKTTWNNLQKIDGHKHDCGRPGINGGFIKNPNVRFGVNCYGNKPDITEEEQKLMNSTTPYPLTQEDRKINSLVKKFKNNISSILVSPFNYSNWTKV
jgi:hypothetical protein